MSVVTVNIFYQIPRSQLIISDKSIAFRMRPSIRSTNFVHLAYEKAIIDLSTLKIY